MAYLILAIISSALVSIVMRLSTGRIKANMGMLAVNYCTALILSLATGSASGFNISASGFNIALLLGAINGVLYMVSLVKFQKCVAQNGVVLSSVFMKLGILVPILLSVTVFAEKPSFVQIMGFLTALISIVIINSGGEDREKKFDFSLVVLLTLSGAADSMAKIFEETGFLSQSGIFFTFTFLVAMSLCLISFVKNGQRIGRNEVLFGCLIGIPNFMSARFLLLALEKMPAVIIYPSYSVATVLVVTLAGILAFREKMSGKQWLAMLLILAALILLNV